jgi:hypothetical protein
LQEPCATDLPTEPLVIGSNNGGRDQAMLDNAGVLRSGGGGKSQHPQESGSAQTTDDSAFQSYSRQKDLLWTEHGRKQAIDQRAAELQTNLVTPQVPTDPINAIHRVTFR